MARDGHKPLRLVCHPRERTLFHRIALARQLPRICESARPGGPGHAGIPALHRKHFAKLQMPSPLTADRLPRTPAPNAYTALPSKNISAERPRTRLRNRETQNKKLGKPSRTLG